jgi:hypothetical protein
MATLTSIQIQALVREMDQSMRRHKGIKSSNFPEFRAKVAAENEVIYHQFPTIFEMHIEGKLDQTFFDMLKMRRRVELGEITDDEASKQVGQQLFNRYVEPVVKKLPAPGAVGSYSDYYKQFDTNASVPSADSPKH